MACKYKVLINVGLKSGKLFLIGSFELFHSFIYFLGGFFALFSPVLSHCSFASALISFDFFLYGKELI